MRTAAQARPSYVAGAPAVVVDGQLAPPPLDAPTLRGVFRPPGAFEAAQLDLVGLVREFVDRVVIGDRAPGEPLVLLDDPAHPALDLLEVRRHERHVDIEV